MAAGSDYADLRCLGVTAIEILPVAQFPGARNWGYDGASLYAVQNSYGGPEGLKRLWTRRIAESDANDPRHIRPPEAGGYDLDAQWSDDFHHAVHAALTGEHQGYYADFGGTKPVAKALAERFVNDGRFSPHRRRHGRPASDVSGDHFVICVQNHDQVGNRPRGDRLSTLVAHPALRLAAAILVLSPYVPLLFMGEEYGEVAPFLYFVSHSDPRGAVAARSDRDGGLVVELGAGETRLVALFNFTADVLRLPLPGGTWSIALSTDAPRYGGEDRSVLAPRTATLAPHGALLLRTGTA
jgi:1,4-alpha-glucan branching enzyme